VTIIYVDADACPVKAEVARVAKRHEFEVIYVSNAPMRLPDYSRVTPLVVGNGFDAADNWIVEQVVEDDIVVTGDIPLASRSIKKGARVIEHQGRIFSEDNIGNILATRNLLQGMRAAGEITGGPAPFAKKDRSNFLQALEQVIQAIKCQ